MNDVKNKKLRKLAGKRFYYQVVNELRMACIDKAIREIEQDDWNVIKELRLQGVLHICKHATNRDLSLSVLGWLAHQNGFKADIALVPKENEETEGKGVIFTDTGVQDAVDSRKLLRYNRDIRKLRG